MSSSIGSKSRYLNVDATRGMLNLSEQAAIGVFGHYGNRNLGDEVTIAAAVQNIRERLPNAKIVAFSIDPEDTAARLNLPAYPIRRRRSEPRSRRRSFGSAQDVTNEQTYPGGESRAAFLDRTWIMRAKMLLRRLPLGQATITFLRVLVESGPAFVAEIQLVRKSYLVLKNIDLLMITGSNQFLDNFGGPWGFPYTLLKWSIIAKLAGSKVIYLCVGAGPISSKLSMTMIRIALAFSDYTSLRDIRSQELIKTIAAKHPTTVFPDLAYSISRTPKAPRHHRQIGIKGQLTVGINPMPVYDRRYWYTHDADKYTAYVKNLAKFSAVLLREDYTLVFWGTQPKDQDVIVDVLALTEKELGKPVNANELTSAAHSVDQVLGVVDALDISIATRFHGVVLSLLAGKAVMSICYHQKMDDLMREMEQSQYSVMLDVLDAQDLLKRFRQLENNLNFEIVKIKRKTEAYRLALASQYDFLFGCPVERSIEP